MLSETILRQISRNSKASFDFDFSSISSEFYEPLFRTLQRYSLKNIDSIGFNCDEMAKYDSLVVKGSHRPKTITSSIAKTKTNYIRNMVELLCYVIPKSTRIKEIRFSNILIQPEHFSRLAQAFAKSTSLKSLSFTRVLLENDGLRIFLSYLDPNKLETLKFVKCRLSDEVADDIVNFISQKKNKLEGLRSFEVSPEEFSDFVIQRITAFVNGAENQTSFLPPASETEIDPDNEMEELESIERQRVLNSLREENRNLKNQIKALKEMVNAVTFGESLFVVGQGAPDFVSYLNDVEQRLVDLDGGRKI